MRPRPDFGEKTYAGKDRLRDRVALVTGGDSGIGRAVSLAFAREGADVCVGYLEEHDDAHETARVVEESGQRAIIVPGDIADDAHCAAIVAHTIDAFGRIDVLVNNAAFQGEAVERFEDIDAERVERTFRVNVVSMFHIVRHALPYMREGSAIINVASVQAYKPTDPRLRGDEGRDRHVQQRPRARARRAWHPRQRRRTRPRVDAAHPAVLRREEDPKVR